MRRIVVLLAAAGLSSGTLANGFSSQLAAMSPLARTTMFQNYMSTAGKTCGAVTRIFFKGSLTDGSDLWNVQCSQGTAWSVRIAAKGTTRIADCATAAAQGFKCWTPLVAQRKR